MNQSVNLHNKSLSFQEIKEEQQEIQIQVDQNKNNEKNAQNLRWGDKEHTLYIIFLEINREKVKFKHIRRSNSFFRQMASFIQTKSNIQCRSHHQKYEMRFKYPHRIIKMEKQKIGVEKFEEELKIMNRNPDFCSYQQNILKENQIAKKLQKEEKIKLGNISTEIQTEIQGVNTVFLYNEVTQPPINQPPINQFFPLQYMPPMNYQFFWPQ